MNGTDHYYVTESGKIKPVRTTTIPYREWPLRARIVERIFRFLNNGQIRTLVVREPEPGHEIAECIICIARLNRRDR